MTDRDPRCVYVADDSTPARIAVTWLADHGIAADVMGELTPGGFEELTGLVAHGSASTGVQVWVKDAADADAAREHLATWVGVVEAQRERRAALTGDLIVACEDCGKQVVFAASQAGNVEDCPHCGSYIDVPDPDGESFDVGDAEADEEG